MKQNSLPKTAWCPICGAKLSVTEKDGRKMLTCPKDGQMNCFLDSDPFALVKHCDDLGIDDLEEQIGREVLEAGVRATVAIAEGSFEEAP